MEEGAPEGMEAALHVEAALVEKGPGPGAVRCFHPHRFLYGIAV